MGSFTVAFLFPHAITSYVLIRYRFDLGSNIMEWAHSVMCCLRAHVGSYDHQRIKDEYHPGEFLTPKSLLCLILYKSLLFVAYAIPCDLM